MIGLHKLKAGHWPVFLISMISAMTNLFLPVVLVRILDPIDIGIYKIFFLYAQTFTFLSLSGAPLYSVYYWIGKKENSLIYVEHAWMLSFSLSTLTALSGLIFLPALARLIAISETQTMLLLLSVITAAPASFYGDYLIAKGRRINGSLFNSGFEVLKAIMIIGLVYTTRSLNAAFWGFSILFLIKLILAIMLSKKEKIVTFTFHSKKLNEVWKYCAPLSLAGALGYFLSKIDMILLSKKLTPENFAFYSMGCLSVPPLMILEMSVQKVLIPALSKAFHDQDQHSMVQHYRQAQSNIGYLIIPAVFGLMIFNRPIIEILFTAEYMQSAVYLKYFALTYLSYIIPHDAIPRASGHTHWILKMYLLLTPLSILAVYFAAGKWGAIGALIVSIVFTFIPKIPGLIYSSNLAGSSIIGLIAWRALAFYAGINLLLAIISYALKNNFETEKMWFLVLAPLYALVYLGLVNYIKYRKGKYEHKN